MIQLLLLLKDTNTAAPPGISVDSVSAIVEPDGLGSCACPWAAAVVSVSWNATGFDSGLHDFRLTRNSTVVYTGNNQTYDHTVVSETAVTHAFADGSIATRDYWTADWDWRVDIIRVADGAVIATNSVNFVHTFGRCPGSFC